MSAFTLETPIDLRARLSGMLEASVKSDDVQLVRAIEVLNAVAKK